MYWTSKLVEYWIEFYPSLKEYDINFRTAFYDDEEMERSKVRSFRMPFEEQIFLNVDFDYGLKYLKKFYGEDIGNVLGLEITEAKQKKGWAIRMLKGLLLNSNKESSTWMSKVIGG